MGFMIGGGVLHYVDGTSTYSCASSTCYLTNMQVDGLYEC